MKRIGHAFENLLQSDHFSKKALDVVRHDVLLASGNGIRAVLERR